MSPPPPLNPPSWHRVCCDPPANPTPTPPAHTGHRALLDVYDGARVKRELDDWVADFMLEPPYKLAEDMRLSNVKIALMVLACGFACVAQFAPIPFPAQRWFLGLFVLAYFLLSGALQVGCVTARGSPLGARAAHWRCVALL